jgi:hypothetical protein
MMQKSSNLPGWLVTNAWREIFARIFESIEERINVSPEWLVNPVTNRRLKLDLLYPQIGVAIRFEGLQTKQRRQRPSLEEEELQQIRDRARHDVCRTHGVELIVVDTTAGDPKSVFQDLDLSLSRAKAQARDKELVRQIGQARASAAKLARQLKHPNDLKLYAELWEDRQFQISEPAQVSTPVGDIPDYAVGMEVEHSSFGPGVIVATTLSNGDTLITVDFVTAGQKTLAASLVVDKLHPR